MQTTRLRKRALLLLAFLPDRLVFQNLLPLSNGGMSGITEIDRKTPGGRRYGGGGGREGKFWF